jgi:hypothetical protein
MPVSWLITDAPAEGKSVDGYGDQLQHDCQTELVPGDPTGVGDHHPKQ